MLMKWNLYCLYQKVMMIIYQKYFVNNNITCMDIIQLRYMHGVPSDEDIALISQRMAHKWRLVGLDLGIDPAELDQIASEDVYQCSSELFSGQLERLQHPVPSHGKLSLRYFTVNLLENHLYQRTWYQLTFDLVVCILIPVFCLAQK